MKRLVLSIAVVLVVFYGLGVLSTLVPRLIYGPMVMMKIPGPSPILLPMVALGFILLVALLIYWIFVRSHRQSDTGRDDNIDMEQLVRELHRTARNLEKRLESLETILLDRTRTPL